jgi:hypothetical protein
MGMPTFFALFRIKFAHSPSIMKIYTYSYSFLYSTIATRAGTFTVGPFKSAAPSG